MTYKKFRNVSESSTPLHQGVPTGYKVIAIIEFIQGALSLWGLISLFVSLGSPVWQRVPPVYLAVSLASSALLILGIGAGWYLWRGQRMGIIGSLVLQLLAIPRFGYRMTGLGTASEVGINFVPLVLFIVLLITYRRNSHVS